MNPLIDQPEISRFVREHDDPGIEVRVNFGVFAGRHATPAEIDELAAALGELVPVFAILAEERHEFAGSVEAKVHQVVVEVPRDAIAGSAGGKAADAQREPGSTEPDFLAGQIVHAANGWALDCIASRHGPGEL
jgi:hypothetical protein